MVSKSFGKAVRVARVRRDLTQAELAQAARIRQGTVGRIERGEREPTLSVIVRIAESLGMKGWELIRAMEDERPTTSPPA